MRAAAVLDRACWQGSFKPGNALDGDPGIKEVKPLERTQGLQIRQARVCYGDGMQINMLQVPNA